MKRLNTSTSSLPPKQSPRRLSRLSISTSSTEAGVSPGAAPGTGATTLKEKATRETGKYAGRVSSGNSSVLVYGHTAGTRKSFEKRGKKGGVTKTSSGLIKCGGKYRGKNSTAHAATAAVTARL